MLNYNHTPKNVGGGGGGDVNNNNNTTTIVKCVPEEEVAVQQQQQQQQQHQQQEQRQSQYLANSPFTCNMVQSSSSSSSSSSLSCNKLKSDLSTRIISGSIGSVLTSLLVTPLEVVKIRLQASSSSSASTTTTSSLVTPNSIKQQQQQVCPKGCGTVVFYNGHLDCVISKSWFKCFDPITGKLRQQSIIQQQQQNLIRTTGTLYSNSNIGTIAMLRRIFAEEGVSGIYSGLRPTLVMAIPNTVLYFSAYDELVFRFKQYYHKMSSSSSTNSYNHYISDRTITSTFIPLVSGASARLLSSTITAPFELLRTRQAADVSVLPINRSSTRSTTSMWSEFYLITKNEGGYRSLFQGLKPTLYRDVPFSAIYWVCIEQFKLLWKEQHNNINNNTNTNISSITVQSPIELSLQAFVNGAVAGMIAAACTTPFDVIKTRQQAKVIEQFTTETIVNSASTTLPSSITSTTNTNSIICNICNHNGMIAVSTEHARNNINTSTSSTNMSTIRYIQHIAQTEGVSALWRGNQARMLKVAPSCAIMISSYELGKLLL